MLGAVTRTQAGLDAINQFSNAQMAIRAQESLDFKWRQWRPVTDPRPADNVPQTYGSP